MKELVLILLIAALGAAYTDVRFAHVSYNTSAVDLLINGSSVTPNPVDYDTITGYLRTNAGSYDIEIVTSTTRAVLFNGTLHFDDMKTYTVFGVGSSGTLIPVLLEDNNAAPADQFTAQVRFFQGVSDIATAEILLNGAVIATVDYEKAAYVSLPAGTATIGIRVKGGASPVYTTPLSFLGGQVYTLAFSGLVSEAVSSVLASDASYQYFSLRVAHMSPDAPAVDVFLKDENDNISTKVAPNLAFKGITAYAVFTAVSGKSYTTIVTVANTNQILANGTTPVASDSVLTISLVGLVSVGSHSFQIVYLTDNNVAPANSWSNRVRFFHALPGTAAVSLSINNQVIFSNANYAVVTDYAVVQTGTFVVSLSIDGQVMTSTTFNFAGGAVVTIFAEGLVGANSTQTPSLQFSADASFTYFTVRVTHAAPGVPTSTFMLRDAHAQTVFNFGAVAYGLVTDYSTLPVQAPLTLYVQTSANSSYSAGVTFKTGDVATLALFGQAATLQVETFADINTPPKASTVARVRFINGVVGTTVSVKFGDTAVFNTVPYLQGTAYNDVDAGTYNIAVYSGEVTIATFSGALLGGGVYTIIAEGITGANSTVPVTGVVHTDDTYEYFNLKFVHAAPNAGNVDVLLDDGHTSTAAFNNVAYQQFVGYTEFVLSNFTLKVTPAGNKNTVLLSPYPHFAAGVYYTVSIMGLTGPNTTTPLSALVVTDVNSAPADSNTAMLKFIHAVAGGAPNVDVYFNDKIVFTNVSYAGLKEYTNVAAGIYRIDLYQANTNNHLQALNDYQVAGGQDTIVVAMGTPGNIGIVASVNSQWKYFQFRFVHTSPNAGPVAVLLEGETIWNSLSFGNITEFKEFTSDKKTLTVTSNGETLVSSNQPFSVEPSASSVLFIGTTTVNTSAPLALLINVENPTVPSANNLATVRVIHTSPDAPALDVKLNDTAQFPGVQYKQITAYQQIAAGHYNLSVFTNHSIATTLINLVGGYSYTIFIEGMLTTGLSVGQSIDYIPPSTGFIRFFHASPDTGAVDLLVDGSADFRNVAFETASDYHTPGYQEGPHGLRIVPTDQRVPTFATGTIDLTKDTWNSVFFIGLQNQTANETSTLEALVLADEHTLPAFGDILIRFIHASPNAPALDIRANGITLFSGVTYKNFTTYHLMDANTYTLELFESGKTDVLLSSKFDLSVPEKSAAIYTLVAEGLYGNNLKVLAFLDNGPAPPKPIQSSSSKPGLGAVAIGLIVAGVIVAVIALAAGGYVLYRRKRRAGYSEIATHEH